MITLLLLGSVCASRLASASQQLGTKRLVAVMVRIGDDRSTFSDAALRSAWQARVDQFKKFNSVSSSGRVDFDIELLGPVLLPESICLSRTADPTGKLTNRALLPSAVEAIDASVDFGHIDGLVALTYTNLGWQRCDLPSEAPELDVSTSEGTFRLPVAWVNFGDSNDAYTLIHEWGHGMGQFHLDPVWCRAGDERLPLSHQLTDYLNGVCTFAPTNVALDPLGSYGLGTMQDWLMARKLAWGWTTEDEVAAATPNNVPPSEAESAQPFPFELPTWLWDEEHVAFDPWRHYELHPVGDGAGQMAVTIPLLKSEWLERYVLEYRAEADLDPLLGYEPGVYLFAVTRYGGIIPVEPMPFAAPETFTMRPLAVGSTFRDEQMGVEIRIDAVAKAAAVSIRFD